VRCHQADWFVSTRETYKESEDYQEIQWTLVAKGKATIYLIRSEEKKEAGLECVWVLTKQIPLNSVQHQSVPENWQPLFEEPFVSAPPQAVKLGPTLFNFDGETSCRAKDDEGLLVTKLTWDYYDDTRTRNVVIEVWKESDRDYPEAYEGTVVQTSEFEILPEEKRRAVLRKVKPAGKGLLPALWTFVFIGLFLFLSGVPLDYLIAGIVPVFAIVVLVQEASLFWSLVAGLMWIALAGMFFFMDRIQASFWGVALGALAVSILVPRIVASARPDLAEGANGPILFTNLLPPLWIYSFFIYFKCAPGPHEAFQLITACLLPVAITSIVYLITRRFQNAF